MTNGKSTNEEIPDETSDIIEHDKSDPPTPHMKYRISKTILILLTYMVYAMFNEIYGPTLPGLKIITNTNNEGIGGALAIRSLGIVIGIVLGGLLADIWKKQLDLSLAIFLILSGVTLGLVPTCRTLYSLNLLLLFHAACSGIVVLASSQILVNLWPNKLTVPVNFAAAGTGIGCTMVPLFLKAFDKGPGYNNKIKLYGENGTVNSKIIDDTANFLMYPYALVGGVCVLVAFFCLIYFIIPNPISPDDKDSSKSSKDDRSISASTSEPFNTCPDKLKSAVKMWAWEFYYNLTDARAFTRGFIGFVASVCVMGTDIVINKYMFSFAVEGELALPNSTAYIVQTVYYIAFSMGRIIVSLLAIKVSPNWLLLTCVIGLTIISVIQSLIQRNLLVFYVCIVLFGIFDSPNFPTIFGVLRLSDKISTNLITVLFCGNSVGASVFQYIVGFLIYRYGFFTVPYSILFGSVLSVISVVILIMVSNSLTIDRYDRIEEENDIPSNVHSAKTGSNNAH